jgi:hypothetical protein
MSFTCPKCQRTSHNPNDEANGFCGACDDFTGAERGIMPDLKRGVQLHEIEHNTPIFLEEMAGAKKHVILIGSHTYGVGDKLVIHEANGPTRTGRSLHSTVTYVSQRLVENLNVMSIRVEKVTGIVKCPHCGSVDARCPECAYVGGLGLRAICPNDAGERRSQLQCLCGWKVSPKNDGVLDGKGVLHPFVKGI